MAKTNDAVLVPCAHSHELARVVSVTEGDHRAIAEVLGNVKVESKPGEWPVVGRYVWEDWFFGFCGRYVFEPLIPYRDYPGP